MKKMDLFKDLGVKGIVVKVIDNFSIKDYTFTKYLCYTKDHRLIILIEKDIKDVKVIYNIDEILAIDATIPAYDLIIANSLEYSYHNIDIIS